MSTHIQSFHIQDYKGLHDLELSGLNQINILTGNNNSGKTSILELLSTLGNTNRINVWLKGARISSLFLEDKALFSGIVNLFPIDQEEKHLGYRYKDTSGNAHCVDLFGTLFEDQLTIAEINQLNHISVRGKYPSEEHPLVYKNVHAVQLSIKNDGAEIAEYTIYDIQYRPPRTVLQKSQPMIFITPFSHQDWELNLNRVVQNADSFQQLIELLQIFDPDILNVVAVKSENSSVAVSYQILSKAHAQSLPLSAYGDGMKKAVVLLSGLVMAKGGILLVDEFETGIHTSGMDKVFRVLLEGALKNDVQVFLTSHSIEAINKILRVAPSVQEKINCYTLYKHQRKNYVRKLTAIEAINAQDKMRLELR